MTSNMNLTNIRKQTIEDGANTMWEWVNCLYDNENTEEASRIIREYTVDMVIADAEEAVLNCWVVDLQKPLTKTERERVRKMGENLIKEAREELEKWEAEHKPAEAQKEEPKEVKGDRDISAIIEAVRFLEKAPEKIRASLEAMDKNPNCIIGEAATIKVIAEMMIESAKALR